MNFGVSPEGKTYRRKNVYCRYFMSVKLGISTEKNNIYKVFYVSLNLGVSPEENKIY
jgi:hypothetical protein